MIRVGIIGMGFGANFHVPAFKRLKGVEVTALSDNGSGKAKKCASLLSLTPSIYSSGEDLIASNIIDVVSISSPPELQKKLVLAAIKKGKDVLCEKPFGLSVLEATSMVEAAKKYNIKASVGFEMRYDRGIATLEKMVRTGCIGENKRITVKWLTNGGANPKRLYSWRDEKNKCAGIVGEYGSHVFDYASWILQSPISEVYANAKTIIKRRPDINDQMQIVTVPDYVEVNCTFINGAKGDFVISNACDKDYGHAITIEGSKGKLSMTLSAPYQEKDIRLSFIGLDGKSNVIPMPEPLTNLNEDTRRGAFNVLIENFIYARNKHLDFYAGLAVQKTISAIFSSINNNCLIKV